MGDVLKNFQMGLPTASSSAGQMDVAYKVKDAQGTLCAEQIRPLDRTRIELGPDQLKGDLRIEAPIVNARGTASDPAAVCGDCPVRIGAAAPAAKTGETAVAAASTTSDVSSAPRRSSTCAKVRAPLYPVLGQLNPGENYRVTGKNDAGDWWQIDIGGEKKGWVITQLVTPPAPPTRSPSVTDIPAPTAVAAAGRCCGCACRGGRC